MQGTVLDAGEYKDTRAEVLNPGTEIRHVQAYIHITQNIVQGCSMLLYDIRHKHRLDE